MKALRYRETDIKNGFLSLKTTLEGVTLRAEITQLLPSSLKHLRKREK